MTGTRLTPPHALGSPEWWQALQEARARIAGEPAERPGTWGALVTSYRASPRFPKDLAPRTRKDYQAVLDYLAPLHDVVLTRWSRSFVAGLRDKAQTQKGRRFANYVLSVVSVVFAHGIEFELAATNPVRDVRKLRRPKGEALAAGRDSWNRTAGTRTRISAKSGKVVVVKAPEVVVAALHRLPAHAAATLLVNSRGEPWAENGLRGSFFRLIRTLDAARVGWRTASPSTVCATLPRRRCAGSASTRARSPTCSVRRPRAWRRITRGRPTSSRSCAAW